MPPSNALVLANRLPYPLDDGWKMRTFHVVRSVAAAAPTTLVVFHPADDDALAGARAAWGPGVRVVRVDPPTSPRIARYVRGAVTRWPLHVWNQESPALRATLRRLVSAERFDCCVAVTTFFERYSDELPAGALRVIDTHNIDSLAIERYARTDGSLARRAYAWATAAKLRALEARAFGAADLVWVCSDHEVEIAHARAPEAVVRVAPNGVDTARFAPPPGIVPRSGRMLFFGKLDYFPNADALSYFAEAILPRIRQARPDAELVVVGGGARDAADALAARHAGIRVVGRVDDVLPHLAEAAVVVVPLRVGGGTRLKIVEALSAGRPLVSTTIGAEGLELDAGRHLLLEDAPEAFASAVLSLLDDPARAERLGRAGREATRARYDWARIGAGIVADLRETAERRAGPRPRRSVPA